MTSTRHLAFFLAPILALQACAPAVEPGPTLEELEAEVRTRSEMVVAAEMAKEWERAVTFFTPDVVVQPANAPQVQGLDALLHLYETALATMTEFESTNTDIVPAASGDLAYEYGINHFVFETPDGPVEDLGKYLAVWRKIEGEWYIAALAFSSDVSPPA
jgi:ketosteroid isomerase-like protein